MTQTLDDKLVVMLQDAAAKVRKVGKDPAAGDSQIELSYALARIQSAIEILSGDLPEDIQRTDSFLRKLLP